MDHKYDYSKGRNSVVRSALANFSESWSMSNFAPYEISLIALGCPINDIYSKLEIFSATKSKEKIKISAVDLLDILNASAEFLNDESVGAKVGNLRAAKDIGLRYHIAYFSKDLNDALASIWLETSLLIPFVCLRRKRQLSSFFYSIDFDVSSDKLYYAIELEIIFVLKLIRSLIDNPHWKPEYISFKHKLSDESREFIGCLYACPLVDNAEDNGFLIPDACGNRIMPGADSLAKSIMTAAGRRLFLESIDQFSFEEQIYYLIVRHFEYFSIMPKSDEIADYFGVSLATFQRSLKDNNISYQELKNKFVRQSYCVLSKLGYDTGEISRILSYSSSQSLLRNAHIQSLVLPSDAAT